ncbi:MAG: hypothetical protein Q8O88_00505 [bacterium]|nr:hypothetical protein [bacterium]
MHFFLDVDNLTNQNQIDGFGPDIGNPSNVYNVSSRFQLNNNSKAFACVNGDIIVQQSSKDPSLVNVILKPLQPSSQPTDVQYFIYRGILKSTLIDGINIAQATNEMTTRFYDQSPTEVGANFLGFSNISGDTNVKDLFDQNVPNVYTMPILEGEWFGDFGHSIVVGANNENYKIGFEIILESDRLQIDLNYLRQHNPRVDVTGLTGYQMRAKRDEIISYIDPVAFFGLYYNTGINTSTFSGGVKNTVSKNKTTLYNEVLNKFATKNKVYLDIRSEKGYSYNFYSNYGDATTNNNIQLGYRGSAPSPQEYHTNNWPIISIEASQSSGTVNTIRFKLRIDDNRVPIIFLPNKNVLSKPKSFIDKRSILSGTNIDWSQEITFQFPNIVNGSNRDNYPYYIKTYYYRQYNDNPVPQTVLDYNSFYNGAFCPIDFVGKTFRSSFPTFVREKMNDDGTGNFAYLASNGAYLDDNRVIFYANCKLDEKILRSEKNYLPTYYTSQLEIENADFNNASINCNLYTIKRDYSIGQTTKRIPGINAYKNNAGILQEKEDALLLGLTIAELDTLRNTIGLDLAHDRYIYLDPHPNNPRTDNDGIRYLQFTVQLQGLDNNGNAHTVQTPLVIYSRDKGFFSTENFGAIEDVTSGVNRLEYHIYELSEPWNRPDDAILQQAPKNPAPQTYRQYRDGCFLINDNIDLSLVYDTQRMFYIFHENNGLTHEVCNLDIVTFNKMGNGRVVTQNYPNSQPDPGWIDERTYTGGDATNSYYYADGRVLTFGTFGNPDRVVEYRLDGVKKKKFLVHFTALDFPDLNIEMGFYDTQRYYISLAEAAAFIGALVKVGFRVESTGFAFIDGTCYPSTTHVNGSAVDSRYQVNLEGTWSDEQEYVDAMFRYGFEWILRGSSVGTQLELAVNGGTLHDSHLHVGFLWIPSCYRNL